MAITTINRDDYQPQLDEKAQRIQTIFLALIVVIGLVSSFIPVMR